MALAPTLHHARQGQPPPALGPRQGLEQQGLEQQGLEQQGLEQQGQQQGPAPQHVQRQEAPPPQQPLAGAAAAVADDGDCMTKANMRPSLLRKPFDPHTRSSALDLVRGEVVRVARLVPFKRQPGTAVALRLTHLLGRGGFAVVWGTVVVAAPIAAGQLPALKPGDVLALKVALSSSDLLQPQGRGGGGGAGVRQGGPAQVDDDGLAWVQVRAKQFPLPSPPEASHPCCCVRRHRCALLRGGRLVAAAFLPPTP